MTGLKTNEELLAMPIASIIDGWRVDQKDKKFVYLFVRVSDRAVQTILVPVEDT